MTRSELKEQNLSTDEPTSDRPDLLGDQRVDDCMHQSSVVVYDAVVLIRPRPRATKTYSWIDGVKHPNYWRQKDDYLC